MSILIYSLIIILVINLIGFLWGYNYQSDKGTDLIYSLSFLIVSILAFLKKGDFELSKILLTTLIVLWAIRLGTYLFIRIHKIKKDDRFDDRRTQFWSFARFWMLQAISIFIIISPVLIYLGKDLHQLESFQNSTAKGFGFAIAIAGLVLETIADYQKYTFRNDTRNKGLFIQSGVWKLSQHPNYLGEILFWFGTFIFVAPDLVGVEWLSIIGPLWIYTLLTRISGIPFLQKSADKKYGHLVAYQTYKTKTPLLFPFGR